MRKIPQQCLTSDFFRFLCLPYASVHTEGTLTSSARSEAALECHHRFAEACQGSKNIEFWTLHVKFLCQARSMSGGTGTPDWSALLIATCTQAHALQCGSEKIYVSWVRVIYVETPRWLTHRQSATQFLLYIQAEELHSLGRTREAFEVCEFGTTAAPKSCQLWLLWVTLAMETTG